MHKILWLRFYVFVLKDQRFSSFAFFLLQVFKILLQKMHEDISHISVFVLPICFFLNIYVGRQIGGKLIAGEISLPSILWFEKTLLKIYHSKLFVLTKNDCLPFSTLSQTNCIGEMLFCSSYLTFNIYLPLFCLRTQI